MKKHSNYTRKVIYIALIGIALVPISFLSRPTTRGGDNTIKDQGGIISRLRNEHELSQAKLSEIDAASEALRFSLLGMRGIASTSLWLQANEAKKNEDWNSFEATLNTLVKIQPNFVKVWEYQAHNLSYNVSVEFDDYEFRYMWVKKGINFLTEGIPFNRRDHRITDNLGFFTGQKIGRADERVQFRQLFRDDDDFHGSMSRFPYIHKETRGKEKLGFDSLDFGPDNWLLAYQWYDRSREMVDVGVEGDVVPQRSSDYLFYMKRPAQLRNHVMSLQKEEQPTESFIYKWDQALDHWLDFGRRTMRSQIGVDITLEGMDKSMKDIDNYREELEVLAPGVRERIENEIIAEAAVTEEDRRLLDEDPANLTEIERRRVRTIRSKVLNAREMIDRKVAEEASDGAEAKRLLAKIGEAIGRQIAIDRYSDITNYFYWKIRGQGEKKDTALIARSAIYFAQEKKRQSKYDRYIEIDPNTGRPRVNAKGEIIIADGAIQEYEKGFRAWNEILNEYEGLQKGDLAEDLVEEMQAYQEVLKIAGVEWPLNFPLQHIIDRRAQTGMQDGLPTSEDLADRREDGGKGSGDGESGRTIGDDKKGDDKKSNDKKSNDKKSNDKKSNDKKSDNVKSEPKKSDDKKVGEKKSDEKKSDDKKADDKNADPAAGKSKK